MYHNAYRGSTATDIVDIATLSGGSVPGDLPTLQIRLERLNALDLKGAVTGLILLLEPLAAAALEVRTRYAMLRAIKAVVLRVAAALPKARASAPPRVGASGAAAPGSARRLTPSLTLEQRLYDTMASNCMQLLHELDRGHPGYSESHARRRRWAVRNGFRFIGRQVLYALKTGRAWPAGAWQSLHELFVYLVMRGSVRLHGDSLVDEDDFDPECAYKRLLLIGLLAELVEPGRIDAAAIEQVRMLAKGARLIESDGLVGEFGLILVEVGRDRPPRLRPGSLDDPFRGWVLRAPGEFETLVRTLDPFHRYPWPAAA